MKTAAIPSVRVEPEFRAEVEAVLREGETLSEFVEAALRAGVAQRRAQAEFVARGLRAAEQARQTGDYADPEALVTRLARKLADARAAAAASAKP